jgi:hypothetical protein
MRLWTAIVTEIWAEIYLDNRGRHPQSVATEAAPSNWLGDLSLVPR